MSLLRYDICKGCGNMIVKFMSGVCVGCGNDDKREYKYLDKEAREKQKEVLQEIRNRKIDDILDDISE